MRCIVTGASGFIGKNFLLKAPSQWEIVALYNTNQEFPSFIKKHNLSHITAVKCDLTDEIQTKELGSKRNEFDVCLYLAANGNPSISIENPLFDLKSNTVTLINFLNSFQVRRFIFFSSGAVYDGLQGLVSPSVNVNPKLPYAISNLASEQYIKFFHKIGKIEEYVILRFFGAYGPYEPVRKIYSRLINDIAFKNKIEFDIRGNGKNLIDAMYIDDAVAGILKVINSNAKNLEVDFCVGAPSTINQLVQKVGNIFDKNIHINHRGETEEYIQFYALPQAMQDLFNFKPKISLEKGIKELYNFLKNEK